MIDRERLAAIREAHVMRGNDVTGHGNRDTIAVLLDAIDALLAEPSDEVVERVADKVAFALHLPVRDTARAAIKAFQEAVQGDH